jgi:AcrR family transcriptional regulator
MVSEAAVQRGRPGTRDALLDAVDGLLAERGWSACSLQAVARRAGLTTGAIYSTFGSRGALLAASMMRRTGSAGLPVDEPDLARAVAHFARSYHAASQDPGGVNLFIAQIDLLRLGATDDGVAAALADTFRLQLDALTTDVAARRGGSPSSSREVTQRLLAVLQGLMLQQVGFGADLGERAFVDAALDAVGLGAVRLAGLRRPKR